jgi:hypothetical protein
MVPVAGIWKALDDELPRTSDVHGNTAEPAEASQIDVPGAGIFQPLLPVAIAGTEADIANEVFGIEVCHASAKGRWRVDKPRFTTERWGVSWTSGWQREDRTRPST